MSSDMPDSGLLQASTLPPGVSSVLAVLLSSAVVLDSEDRVLSSSVAAREFGLAIGTLRKALNKNSTVPDADGLYTTRQVDAIHGTLHLEKLRTQRARAQKLELENSIITASVLNRAALMQSMSEIADAISSRIKSSGLSRAR